MAKLKSTVGSFFLRIFLLISFALLAAVFAASALLAIWPNIAVGAGSFGVWALSNGAVTSNVSWIGWTLLGVAAFALIFSAIVQLIGRKTKFTIGTRNQIMGYFSSVIIPVVIYTVFAFVGSYSFSGLTVPGYGSVANMFFTSTSSLVSSSGFPLTISITITTWVWWLFGVFALISALNVAFAAIKMILRAIFNKTHDKKVIVED